MAFLDIEHYLELRGKDTWSDDGNRSQIIVKTLIGQILTERMPREVPDLHLRFASSLRPDDHVLTFNYDVLLERALEKAAKPFRLFPDRYTAVGHPDSSLREVIVLKLHGSIDWFDRRPYEELHGLPPGHPVFGPPNPLRTRAVVDGPRYPADPLSGVYRVLDLKKLYRREILFRATPLLLNPSTAKILYALKLRDFWRRVCQLGALTCGMAIIGYSLPPQDNYARQALYQLVRNYQHNNEAADYFRVTKTPLLLVDRPGDKQQEQALRKRYAFVDWTRVQTHFDGFDDRALELLNA
jgi:hypothetical protein